MRALEMFLKCGFVRILFVQVDAAGIAGVAANVETGAIGLQIERLLRLPHYRRHEAGNMSWIDNEEDGNDVHTGPLIRESPAQIVDLIFAERHRGFAVQHQVKLRRLLEFLDGVHR